MSSSGCPSDKPSPAEDNITLARSRFYLYLSLTIVGLVLIIVGVFIQNTVAKTALIIIGIIMFLMCVYPAYQYQQQYEKLSGIVGDLYTFPSSDYMLSIGAQCPDGWVPMSDPKNKNRVICVNYNNIPVRRDNHQKCFDEPYGMYQAKSFKKITEWPPKPEDIKSRCNFIMNCGPTNTQPAVWSGLHCDLAGLL